MNGDSQVLPELISKPTGFGRTVGLLLGAARKRAVGRQKRQRELLRQRSGKSVINWAPFAFFLVTCLMIGMNIGAAFLVNSAVKSAQYVQVEQSGRMPASDWLIDYVRQVPKNNDHGFGSNRALREATGANNIDECIGREASSQHFDYGDRDTIQQELDNAFDAHGIDGFVSIHDATPGLSEFTSAQRSAAMLGSLFLGWWLVMLVFQGEGLELDIQRRRHPMWEWLFSHPVPQGAVFLAEMLSPISANPVYWGAPFFICFLYGLTFNAGVGILAGALIGIPVTAAAACAGKALEIGVMLRFGMRTRGAIIGLMSWLGYTTLMVMIAFVATAWNGSAIPNLARHLLLLARLPWPLLGLFIGAVGNGPPSFVVSLIICWAACAVVIALAMSFSIWGARRGLSGSFGAADSAPTISPKDAARFGREPLYRKEYLWFARDRSAIVQTILIPLTIAGYQLFNMRALLMQASTGWNNLCGAGVLFGTYFLWVLGPKSLQSEGSALWISLTWPRGLESLLKAKAWLWALIATGIMGIILIIGGFMFPASIAQLALVAVGWFFFARSMAEKTVTLVSVASQSGETEKIPWTRRGAASLGMLTFAIGLLTQQWSLAATGIVYSYLTAAAMWQNFRYRLPYLYDPWSEPLPPAPTLMHAMVSISLLVEGGAVLTGIVAIFTGVNNLQAAVLISYCVCSVLVAFGVGSFLSGRGVEIWQIWIWDDASDADSERKPRIGKFGFVTPWLVAGLLGGAALATFAHGYILVLHHFPAAAELIDKAHEQLSNRVVWITYAIAAVGFAPFAEEYLFRGLLYRALDKEWGGWKAVAGSAAFFAIYHPTIAWLPVAMLGAINCLLFKKTGRLAPCVVLHMVYNALVIHWS
jgi:membrane protease YdiL (CAAX protease family)